MPKLPLPPIEAITRLNRTTSLKKLAMITRRKCGTRGGRVDDNRQGQTRAITTTMMTTTSQQSTAREIWMKMVVGKVAAHQRQPQ